MNHSTESFRPAARTSGLLVEHLGDETIIYDTERKEAHCLSPLAALVFAHCDGATSIAEMTKLINARGESAYTTANVVEAVGQLEARELLAPAPNGTSRREMLRRVAATGAAAAALPLITSIVAPTAALASGTCNVGAVCSNDSDCGAKFPSGGGTCSCGPCTDHSGNKLCSLHNGDAANVNGCTKCSSPCTFGGACRNC